MTPTPARTPARRAVADRASAPFDRAPPGPRRRPNPRDHHLTHENVPLADDLAGYPAISRTATPAPDAPEGYSAGVCVHFQEAVSLISPEPAVRGPGRRGVGMNGRGVVLVGLLWRPGARSCPNLPQRRPRPGSAVSGGAEYQQFFSRIPARSGPLWQIWTIRRRGPAGEGDRGPGGGPGACLDDPAGPVDPRRTRGSAGPGQDPDARPDPRGLAHPRAPPGRPDPSRTRRFPVERASPICAFDWKPARSRKSAARRNVGTAERRRGAAFGRRTRERGRRLSPGRGRRRRRRRSRRSGTGRSCGATGAGRRSRRSPPRPAPRSSDRRSRR